MYLTKHDLSIINEIIRNPSIDITYLSEKLDLTKRQIYYSISRLNDLLEKQGTDDKIIRVSGGIHTIDSNTSDHLVKMLQTSRNLTYVHSEAERLIIISFLLIYNPTGDISINTITGLLDVSKNTVISDLKKLTVQLQENKLDLNYSRTEGYSLLGDELNIRKFSFEVASKVVRIYDNIRFFEMMCDISLSKVHTQLSMVEDKMSRHLNDESFHIIAYTLLMSIRRMELGHTLRTFPITNFISNYQDIYKYFDITTDNLNERNWISLILLSGNVIYDDNEIIDKGLCIAINEFVNNFELNSYTTITNREEFINRLSIHIQPAVIRMALGLQQDHIFNNQINHNYRGLFDLVEMSIKPIESHVGFNFSKSELSFIAIHIGGELLNQGLDLLNTKRALVVCSNGIAISRVLSYTLKELFPNFEFVDSLSVRQFIEYDKPYDIVFSTEPITSASPVYLVNAMMSNLDKIKLRQRVLSESGGANIEAKVDSLMKVISNSTTVTDFDLLKKNLTNYFISQQIIQEGARIEDYELDLSDYLKVEYVQVIEDISNWDEALRIATAPLVKYEIIKEGYVQALLNDNTNLSVIGRNVAIPHIECEGMVEGDAFSLLVLNKPIMFQGFQIRMIVPLAIKNETQHVRALMELYEIAQNENLISEICDLNGVNAIHERLMLEREGL